MVEAVPVAAGSALHDGKTTARLPVAQHRFAGVDLANASVSQIPAFAADSPLDVASTVPPVAPLFGDWQKLLAAIEPPATSAFTDAPLAAPAPVLMMPSFASGIEHVCRPPRGRLSSGIKMLA